MIASELVTKLSFIGNLEPLQKLNNGLTTSIKSLGVMSVAYGTIGIAVNSWVDKTLEATHQTINLSKELGVSVEAMQEWQYVAQMNGSTAEALQSSIGGLSERIGEYAKFDSGEGKEVFEKLGIQIKDSEGKLKSADRVMQDLAKSMQGLDVSEQRSIIAKLGIDESMIQTLRLTDEQLNHLKNSASAWGLVTEEQAEQVTKYEKSLTDLGYGFEAIKTQIAIAFAPALEDLITGFKELFKENKEGIQKGLNKGIDVVTSFGRALINFYKITYSAIDSVIDFKYYLMLLGGAILYINRAMFLNPLGIAIGLLVLAIGVVDDLTVAFQGGESVIADFFQSFFDVDIVQVLKDIGSTFGIVVDGIKSGFTDMVNQGKKNFEALKETVKKIVDGILDFFNPVFKIFDKISDFNPFGNNGSSNPLNYNDLGQVHNAPNVPILNDNALLPNSVMHNNNSSTSNTQNNNIKIDVKADNPVLAGQTVVSALNSQMADANRQFNVGGR